MPMRLPSQSVSSISSAKRKPKAKPKQKAAPKPVIVDPDIRRFPTVASMQTVKVKYTEGTGSGGGSSIHMVPRQGEQQTADRRKRAESIDSGEKVDAIVVEQKKLEDIIKEKNFRSWQRQCLAVHAHVKINYGENSQDITVLPDPTKPHPPESIPQPLPPLHSSNRSIATL